MKDLRIIETGSYNIAEILSDAIEIKNAGDALDLMGSCYASKAKALILREHNLSAEFFDLKTGILGEILQKFVNYDFRLAVITDRKKYQSKNMQDFIYESNKTGRIVFIDSLEEATKRLAG